MIIEENAIIGLFWDLIQDNVTAMLEILIGVKLIMLTMIYWFTKLADILNVSKYKWAMLMPFTIATIFIVILDTYIVSTI